MKLVDLFCGCGGFSLGAHKAGFEVVSAYDVDRTLTSSYPLNFPDTKLFHRDISTLTGQEILANAGCVIDGVFGGPPCQGFSSIGRRAKDDPRRSLLQDYFRIVHELDPSFFVMENVQGLTYADALPELHEAVAQVSDRYDILGPQIWDASEFGAATKRARMFMIGIRKDWDAPISEHAINSQKRPATTVLSAIADISSAMPTDSEDEFDRWHLRDDTELSDYALEMRADDAVITGHKSTAHTEAVIKRFSSVAPGGIDSVGRHPRLKWDGLCPTLRAGTGSDKGSYQAVRPIHPTEDRVITVREAARLQGFPDSHLFHSTTWHSFRMIGNSVSPVISRAIFAAIKDHFSKASLILDAAE